MSLSHGAIAHSIPSVAQTTADPLVNPVKKVSQTILKVVYPRPNHKTTAKQIFLIGTAPQGGQVLVNGQPINRSSGGHFAPSLPLQVGVNEFTLQYGTQTLKLKVTREQKTAAVPTGAKFAKDSLQPTVDIARMPGENICLGAITAPKAQVKATIAGQKLQLQPQPTVILPSNKAVLTNQAEAKESFVGQYRGCVQLTKPGETTVEYTTQLKKQRRKAKSNGKVTILNPTQLEVVQVTAENGVSRTGPSTNYSRLTPLPKGTRASVTGSEGKWLRLDYGAWIKRKETKTISQAVPPRSMIRGVVSRRRGDWTELVFPLQTAVPVAVQQHPQELVLSLYNTTAQTDTIKLIDSPTVAYVNWQQATPDRIDYRLQLKHRQQWGYKLRYQGSSLILSLKHPPQRLGNSRQPLKGITILLDAGHGSSEDPGAVGPTGLAEKEVTLPMTKMVRDRLVKLGAKVVMTREGDDDLWPYQRVAQIDQTEPAIALSIHYNALPDSGDAINTAGVSTFWYNPQAQSLADFLQKYLVQKLNRPSDGVMWNNLALTRPTVAPSVLIELGYMINPEEFEWITNPQEQVKLADTLTAGIVEWFKTRQ
ncbi:N-acetylmuramoyl-L-alanine amidase [filamentous cyanobacterium LEGE 11480]|uniref:N-acetylmuramoyl-L-alanine amidase n=2 Tax=Romeriopsis TaxID=2992131 RepID=A0A928Z0R8_9CYAN|nr:N-acetylmuramoyl-L-alanine amidase [Romeriopsis navalis LEGE 11480]